MTNEHAKSFDPNELNPKDMYKLMIGSVVPRPIAWISTQNRAGELNLAPFSFFTVASRNPATLAVTIGPGAGERKGTVKDTLSNIRETEEYVINVVPEELGQAMQKSARNVPPEVNEFTETQLTPEPSDIVSVPSVKESPIAFELKLDQIIPIGYDHLVLGQIVKVHVDEDMYLGDYKTNIEKWKPLARLAGDYASLSPSFKLPK